MLTTALPRIIHPTARIKGPATTMSDYGYTIKEAAGLLGIHWSTLRYHRYESKHFAGIGQLKGTNLLFSDADIERMRALLPAIRSHRGMGMARNPEALVQMTTDERARAAEKMVERGMTLAQIAKELSYSDATAVSRLLSRHRSRHK